MAKIARPRRRRRRAPALSAAAPAPRAGLTADERRAASGLHLEVPRIELTAEERSLFLKLFAWAPQLDNGALLGAVEELVATYLFRVQRGMNSVSWTKSVSYLGKIAETSRRLLLELANLRKAASADDGSAFLAWDAIARSWGDKLDDVCRTVARFSHVAEFYMLRLGGPPAHHAGQRTGGASAAPAWMHGTVGVRPPSDKRKPRSVGGRPPRQADRLLTADAIALWESFGRKAGQSRPSAVSSPINWQGNQLERFLRALGAVARRINPAASYNAAASLRIYLDRHPNKPRESTAI